MESLSILTFNWRCWLSPEMGRAEVGPQSIPFQLYKDRLLIKFKDHLTGQSLLDVGCGDGMWILQCFSQIFSYVVGIDAMKNGSWNRGCPPNADFVVCDATHLPFIDTAFDVCFLNNVLHHSVAPLSILKEVKKRARRTVIVIEANRYDPIGFIHMVKLCGHNHFTRDKFVELIGEAYGSCLRCSFYHARSHYVPIGNPLIVRICGLLMDLLELSHQSSHNIALCMYAQQA